MKLIKQQLLNEIKFFKLMIPNWKKHICIAFFAGLSMLLFNLVSANMLKGIYSAITFKNMSLIYKYICFFVLMIAGVFMYNCICWSLYGSSSAKITGSIRKSIISKISSLSLSDIETNHSANVMSLLTNDLDATQGIYINIRFYIATLISTFIPAVLIFRMSYVLAILIILMGIIQLIVNLFVIRPIERQSLKIRKDMSDINSSLTDVLRNNMSIRLYGSENFYMQICKDINKNLYESKMKLNILNAFVGSINICFGLFGYIILLALGGMLIESHKLSIPNLLFITQIRLMIIQGILAFGDYTLKMQPAIIGVNKILTLMDLKTEEL